MSGTSAEQPVTLVHMIFTSPNRSCSSTPHVTGSVTRPGKRPGPAEVLNRQTADLLSPVNGRQRDRVFEYRQRMDISELQGDGEVSTLPEEAMFSAEPK